MLPLACILMTFGILVGLVFNTGVGHPYDKVIHIGFLRAADAVDPRAFLLPSAHLRGRGLWHGARRRGDARAFCHITKCPCRTRLPTVSAVALIVALIALIRSEARVRRCRMLRKQRISIWAGWGWNRCALVICRARFPKAPGLRRRSNPPAGRRERGLPRVKLISGTKSFVKGM